MGPALHEALCALAEELAAGMRSRKLKSSSMYPSTFALLDLPYR